MDLSKEKVDALLGFLKQTKDREATCEDCLTAMAEFAEKHLEGKSIPESLKAIEDHLEFCGECKEEFEALLATLREL